MGRRSTSTRRKQVEEQDDDSPTYDVEEILAHKVSQGKDFFLIKWKGYDESENTWEPREHLNDELQPAMRRVMNASTKSLGRTKKRQTEPATEAASSAPRPGRPRKLRRLESSQSGLVDVVQNEQPVKASRTSTPSHRESLIDSPLVRKDDNPPSASDPAPETTKDSEVVSEDVKSFHPTLAVTHLAILEEPDESRQADSSPPAGDELDALLEEESPREVFPQEAQCPVEEILDDLADASGEESVAEEAAAAPPTESPSTWEVEAVRQPSSDVEDCVMMETSEALTSTKASEMQQPSDSAAEVLQKESVSDTGEADCVEVPNKSRPVEAPKRRTPRRKPVTALPVASIPVMPANVYPYSMPRASYGGFPGLLTSEHESYVTVEHVGKAPDRGVPGHWVLVRWKDGSERYMPISDVRRDFPRELCDYFIPRIRLGDPR